MRWKPEFDPEEEAQIKTGYMSDNTAYMRWSTEVEPKQNIIDNAFMYRNRHTILGLDKFPALAIYDDPRMLRLHKRKMHNIILALNVGLEPTAEETGLSAIDDVQVSRGYKGNFSKFLITQRHELDTHERTEPQKKAKWFNRFIGGKTQSEEEQENR